MLNSSSTTCTCRSSVRFACSRVWGGRGRPVAARFVPSRTCLLKNHSRLPSTCFSATVDIKQGQEIYAGYGNQRLNGCKTRTRCPAVTPALARALRFPFCARSCRGRLRVHLRCLPQITTTSCRATRQSAPGVAPSRRKCVGPRRSSACSPARPLMAGGPDVAPQPHGFGVALALSRCVTASHVCAQRHTNKDVQIREVRPRGLRERPSFPKAKSSLCNV